MCGIAGIIRGTKTDWSERKETDVRLPKNEKAKRKINKSVNTLIYVLPP